MNKDHLLVHASMEAVLYKLKDNSIDLVLTDPPFGVRKFETWDDKEHFISNVTYWLREMIRVSKHAVIMFGAAKMFPYVIRDLVMKGDEELFFRQHYWEKPAGTQFNGASNNHVWYNVEPIWIFSKDPEKTKSYGQSMPYGYENFSYRTTAFKMFEHPTSKSVGLMRKLIGHYSDSGELILDPFAGSGSTAIAAIDMGRRSLLVEQSPLSNMPISDTNPDYYGNAKERILKHLSQPRLFIGEADDLSAVETENQVETLELGL